MGTHCDGYCGTFFFSFLVASREKRFIFPWGVGVGDGQSSQFICQVMLMNGSVATRQARGMDFQGVNTVINFDFPQSSVSYVHRIGRTGRAGRRGKAITFFTESDFPALRSIANVMKLSGCDVPEWMLRLKTMKTKEKRRFVCSHKSRPCFVTKHVVCDIMSCTQHYILAFV